LNWGYLASRREKRLSIMMYYVLHANTLSYLYDLFSSKDSNAYKSKLRDTEGKLESQSIPRTDFLKKGFSYRGAKLLNSIPSRIRSSSRNVFKKNVFNWQPDNYK
jgi:hypothetical protein